MQRPLGHCIFLLRNHNCGRQLCAAWSPCFAGAARRSCADFTNDNLPPREGDVLECPRSRLANDIDATRRGFCMAGVQLLLFLSLLLSKELALLTVNVFQLPRFLFEEFTQAVEMLPGLCDFFISVADHSPYVGIRIHDVRDGGPSVDDAEVCGLNNVSDHGFDLF
jgi:hypothetical protein